MTAHRSHEAQPEGRSELVHNLVPFLELAAKARAAGAPIGVPQESVPDTPWTVK